MLNRIVSYKSATQQKFNRNSFAGYKIKNADLKACIFQKEIFSHPWEALQ
jgi:hypothetical protein